MNGRSMVMLMLAILLGLGAMLLTRRMMSKPAAKEDETQDIIVAARDFKEEEILKADMVKVAASFNISGDDTLVLRQEYLEAIIHKPVTP